MLTRRALFAAASFAYGGPGSPVRVWEEGSHLGMPDASGRFLSMVDHGNLALRDFPTGAIRHLAGGAGSNQFAYFSAISRDSKRIAYAWFNEAGFYELRTIGVNGGPFRVLHRNEERRFVQPCAWTPDGKQILTLFFRDDNVSQIALVDSESGAVKVLKSLDWVYPNKMDISADGRWIAYDDVAGAGTRRNIMALAMDGSSNEKLVDNGIFPLFAGNHRRVLFLREGDLWSSDPLTVVQKGMGRALPLGITRGGSYYFARRTGGSQVFVGTNPADARPIVLQGVDNATAPEWSPDGKRLAFLVRLGSENFGQESRAIAIVTLDGAGTQLLQPRLPTMERARFSPDGKRLLVSGTDRHGQSGLFVVDIATSGLRPAVRQAGGTYHGLEGVWCGDDICSIRDGKLYRNETRIAGDAVRAVASDGDKLAVLNGNRIEVANRVWAALDGIESIAWQGGDILAIGSRGVIRVKADSPPQELGWRVESTLRAQPRGDLLAFSAGKERTEIWAIHRLDMTF